MTAPAAPPRTLAFDIETDGLLDACTRIHSLVIKDLDTGVVHSCHDAGPVTIADGLEILRHAQVLVGHNALKFDLPVIRKLHPRVDIRADVLDTLVCTRLIWPDVDTDDHRRAQSGNFPTRLTGSHSLEAWGQRLGVLKGDFGKTADWSKWTPEMQKYCEQDVEVTHRLLQHIQAQKYSPDAITLEHRFADIIRQMEERGFCFDVVGAGKLYATLLRRQQDIAAELQKAFPPKTVTWATPKKGLVRTKVVPFNPASRHHVAERLADLGWKPTKRTDTGLPQVDEAVLESLPYPEAKLLAEHFLVSKRIGQLSEGKQAWMHHVRAGRAYFSVNTNRAITGRCGHHNFNIAQVPRVGSPYGKECRELFTASPGMVLVGADASGLELRGLGGFLAHYDGGEYVKIVTDGDVHTVNQGAFGLPPGKPYRQNAKNGIYALIYGAANEKLGETLGPLELFHESAAQAVPLPGWARKSMMRDGPVTPSRIENWKRGAYSRARVETGITGYGSLVADVSAAIATRGFLKGLDGRRLRPRGKHAALNTLLQSAGALLVKRATVLWYDDVVSRGHVWGKDFALVAHVHDEIQVECRPEIADEIGKAFVDAIRRAGESWSFPCPLTGTYSIGKNWAETH